MSSFARTAATAEASNTRKPTPEDYFKSREIYRSDRGFIVVDAFRFVQHFSPIAATTSPGPSTSPTTNPRSFGVKVESARRRFPVEPHKFYFLSHFHSDHYTGIQRSWHTDLIYCSRPTAALTQSELGVSSACLFPMDMDETYIFSMQTGACLACVPETPLHPRVQNMLLPQASASRVGTTAATTTTTTATAATDEYFAVRLIPANHCPGANMFLFVSPVFGTVVHTGDFRFNGSQRHWREGIRSPLRRTYVSELQIQRQARACPAAATITDVPPLPSYEQFIQDDTALREVAEKAALDVLFLDNTFCDPPYAFPTQWEVTQTVVEVLRSLLCRTASRTAPTLPSSPSPLSRRSVRCAVLIGCYTIGKERVALAIRDAFQPVSAQHTGTSSDAETKAPPTSSSSSSSLAVYVSPRRYSMLTAMNFFPECFQPLQASATAAAAAPVVDTPVQLPVLLHSEKAQRIWEEAQGSEGQSQCASPAGSQDTSATSPSLPNVRRSLTSEFTSQLSDASCSPSSGDSQGGETDYLLSVFLVSMANVGYQSVATLTREGHDGSLQLEDNVKLDLTPYDAVLLVEPTGWCKRCSTRAINDKFTLLKVPYSEHCGFHEMMRFVEFVNPTRVVPTVSEENFKKHEALFVEKAPRLRSRVSNVQPITRFFTAAPINRSNAPDVKKEGELPTPVVTNQRSNPRERRAVTSSNAPSSNASKAEVMDSLPPKPEVSASAVVVSADGDRKRAEECVDTAGASSAAQTLERLFQRAKVETLAQDGSSTLTAAKRVVAAAEVVSRETLCDDDEECQVVRVVQTVVEISDDD